MILTVMIKDRFFSPQRKVNRELVSGLSQILVGVILLDLFLAVSDVLVLLTADAEAKEAATLLLRGGLRPYFLGVEVSLGALLPLLLLVFPGTRRNMAAVGVASVLVMIGIITMRYIMVIGGQMVPLS